MKRIVLLTTAVIFSVNGFSQAPAWSMAGSMGGRGIDKGNSITLSLGDYFYIAGLYSDTADFNPGSGVSNLISAGASDAFSCRYNSSGVPFFVASMGGTAADGATAVTVGGGAVFTTGGFSGTADFDPGAGTFNLTATSGANAFISKLTPLGQFQWAKGLGNAGGGIYTHSIAMDGANNIYVFGRFFGTIDFDPGASTAFVTGSGVDAFILKLNFAGNFLWVKIISGPGAEWAHGMKLDAAGNIYATGFFNDSCDFDPGAGTFMLPVFNQGEDDVFVLKLDSSGSFIWAKSIYGIDVQQGLDIDVDLAGNVYSTGIFADSADFNPGAGVFMLNAGGPNDNGFILKLDAGGNFLWAKAITGSGTSHPWAVACDTSGNDVYITGFFDGTVDFDPGTSSFNVTSANSYSDMFLLKLDGAGNFAWVKTVGGNKAEDGNDVVVSSSGKVFVIGTFSSQSLTMDSYTLINNSDTSGFKTDIFIAMLNASTGMESTDIHNSVSVYPVPATDKITVRNNNGRIESIEIFDVLGKTQLRLNQLSNDSTTQVDVASLAAGIYLMTVRTENGTASVKFIRK